MSLFEKIAQRIIPAHIIWEDDHHLAFLDIFPLAEGHTLVIPKKNLGDNIFHLEQEAYVALMKATKQVAPLLEQALPCSRVLMWTEGFEIPHVHVHLLPAMEGVSFLTAEKKEANSEELAKTAAKIR